MRTTIILKDDLIKEASQATGITEKTALIHKGLELLIAQAATDRLIRLGGSMPMAKAPTRRRPKK